MKNSYIEKGLSGAVNSLLPDDGFEKVSAKLTSAERKEVIVMKNSANQKSSKRNFKKIISISVAACLVLVIGAFSFGYYRNNLSVSTVIDIDVNPSIEIEANRNDRVLAVKAINEDAKKVISGLELEDTEINTAVSAIVGSMYQKGYLKADRSDLLITVQNDDKAKADSIRKSISLRINESLKGYDINPYVANQTVTDAVGADEFAKKHSISKGKAVFILRLCELDKSLNSDELAKLSIKEIVAKVNKESLAKMDIIDIDDDFDDIYEEVIESVPPADVELISTEQAKEIALKDAGVGSDAVRFIKAELDKEGAAYIYEIDFKVGQYEYEYDINAKNGNIIKKNKEYDDDGIREDVDKVDLSVISVDQAKDIALKHAGLKASEVSFIKAELDKDDGIWEYEIEFRKGKYEYEYTVNGLTKEIIDFSKEIDD